MSSSMIVAGCVDEGCPESIQPATFCAKQRPLWLGVFPDRARAPPRSSLDLGSRLQAPLWGHPLSKHPQCLPLEALLPSQPVGPLGCVLGEPGASSWHVHAHGTTHSPALESGHMRHLPSPPSQTLRRGLRTLQAPGNACLLLPSPDGLGKLGGGKNTCPCVPFTCEFLLLV